MLQHDCSRAVDFVVNQYTCYNPVAIAKIEILNKTYEFLARRNACWNKVVRTWQKAPSALTTIDSQRIIAETLPKKGGHTRLDITQTSTEMVERTSVYLVARKIFRPAIGLCYVGDLSTATVTAAESSHGRAPAEFSSELLNKKGSTSHPKPLLRRLFVRAIRPTTSMRRS